MFEMVDLQMLDMIRAKTGASLTAALTGYYARSIYRNIILQQGIGLPDGPIITPAILGMLGWYIYDSFVESNKPSGAELMLGGAVGVAGNFVASRVFERTGRL